MIKTLEARPPRVEAVQFDGDNREEIVEFFPGPVGEPETDDEGAFVSVDIGGLGYPDRLPVGGWLIRYPYRVLTDAQKAEEFEEVVQ